eukprot:TRINITY_DN40710_c0_g2_i1.p2 TRINITY_DN40710_c0_g2~~TRINITY_DN40710_c0_g2_i1.p2  ORF type:complete len:193 (+),score=6.58 TRINITY_DN40710_c0_g2_i1:73-579(+)
MWSGLCVGDVMRGDPVCLNQSTSVKTAAKVMALFGISGVPVVEPFQGDTLGAGRLVGIISQRDIVWKETVPYPGEDDLMHGVYEGPMQPVLSSQLEKIKARKVSEAMTRDPLYVEADADVSEAAAMMINHSIARLPVVAPREAGKTGMTVVGILTCSDILQHTIQLLP